MLSNTHIYIMYSDYRSSEENAIVEGHRENEVV